MAVQSTSDPGSSRLVFSHPNGCAQDDENVRGSYTIDGKNLQELILSQDLKMEMSFLLFILAGMEECGKSNVLNKIFEALVNPTDQKKDLSTVGEYNPEGLSWYELAVAGDSEAEIDWSFFTRSSGYLHCFLSALVQYAKRENVDLRPDSSASNTKYFEDSTLDKHFKSILEGLHWQLFQQEHRQNRSKLLGGLSLVNIWDLEGMNEPVMLALSLVVGQLKHSFAILGLNLEQHVQTLLGFQPAREERCSKEFFRLLRLVNLTRGHNVDRKHTCVLAGLVKTSQKLGEEEPAHMKLLMKQTVPSNDCTVDTEKFFAEPWTLNANKPGKIKELLDNRILDYRKQFTKAIPLSWVLLRSAFFKSGEMYVDTETLKKVASELRIEGADFEQFLADFTAMGSIIYNTRIPALKDFVILNPVDFCYHLNRLFKPRFDGDLKKGVVPMSYLKRIFGKDTPFFVDVLTSTKHAIELNASSLDTHNQPPRSESVFYFIPTIRKTPQHTEIGDHSLLLRVKSTLLPNNVGQLLTEDILRDPETRLVPTEYSNVALFKYNNLVQFEVISHCNAYEIRLDSDHSSHPDLVEAVRTVILNACRYVKEKVGKDCVPFTTEIQDFGLNCSTGEGFHSIPGNVNCPECKDNFSAWYHTYSKIIEGVTEEVKKFCECYPTAEPLLLTNFGKKLSQVCLSETDEKRKDLMKALRLPPQSCSPSKLQYKIISALHSLAGDKEGDTFALHQILHDVSPNYGTMFLESFA